MDGWLGLDLSKNTTPPRAPSGANKVMQVKTPLVKSELSKHGACIELHKVNRLQLRVYRLRRVNNLRRINKGHIQKVVLFGQQKMQPQPIHYFSRTIECWMLGGTFALIWAFLFIF